MIQRLACNIAARSGALKIKVCESSDRKRILVWKMVWIEARSFTEGVSTRTKHAPKSFPEACGV